MNRREFLASVAATAAFAATGKTDTMTLSVTPWAPFRQAPATTTFSTMEITVVDTVGGTDINVLIVDASGNPMGYFPETHAGVTAAGTNVYTSDSLGVPVRCQASGPWFPAARIRSSGVLVPAAVGTRFGDVHLLIGQSNMEHMWSQSSSPPTPDPDTMMYLPGTGWTTPTGNGVITFLNTLRQLYGSHQAVLACAVSGTAMTLTGSLLNSQFFGGPLVPYWTDPTSAMRVAMAAAIAACGGDIANVIQDQGETDSGLVPPEFYFGAQCKLWDDIQTLVTGRKPPALSFGMIETGFNQPSPTLGFDPQAIRAAQRWFVKTAPGAYMAAGRSDLPRAVDNQHLTPAGYGKLGARMAGAVYRNKYLMTD